MSDTVLGWLFGGWHFGSREREPQRAIPQRQSAATNATKTNETHRAQEQAWLADVQSGSVDAFRTIFESYAPRLQHFAQLWVSRDAAEDIVQDVFFDLWQRRATLDPNRGQLTAYLFSAVRHHVSKHVRHHTVVVRAEQREQDIPLGMGHGPGEADARVLSADLQSALGRGMATLSETQRAVLMLRWVQHMPFAQIAATLSISENAAKLHASRARQALYRVLKPLFEG